MFIFPMSTFSKAVVYPDTSDILKYEFEVSIVYLSFKAVCKLNTSICLYFRCLHFLKQLLILIRQKYLNMNWIKFQSACHLSFKAVCKLIRSLMFISPKSTLSKAVVKPDTSNILKYEFELSLFSLSFKAACQLITSLLFISPMSTF